MTDEIPKNRSIKLIVAYKYHRTSMLKFLPERDRAEILATRGAIEELRVRKGQPINVLYSYNGERKRKILSRIYSEEDIENIIMKLCDYTFYSKEESIRQGFITSSEGERVGICGNVVKKNGEVSTIKQITSLCVRMPNDVDGIARPFFCDYAQKAVGCLVISPPGQGKTTFLRDLGRIYSDKLNKNVVFIDERDEFSASGRFYLGKNSDAVKYADKEYGFSCGVRTLAPEVIVCDEIMTGSDIDACEKAAASGVKVLASAHSDNLKNLLKKAIFTEIIKKRVFDFYIELFYGGNITVYNEAGEKC